MSIWSLLWLSATEKDRNVWKEQSVLWWRGILIDPRCLFNASSLTSSVRWDSLYLRPAEAACWCSAAHTRTNYLCCCFYYPDAGNYHKMLHTQNTKVKFKMRAVKSKCKIGWDKYCMERRHLNSSLKSKVSVLTFLFRGQQEETFSGLPVLSDAIR